MEGRGLVHKRKLIEVALPLEAINRESAREKSIRHGHPSTLHLWWARRPLAAARAVIFSQLVDDPSAHPDDFPTEELQRAERERLHRLIERLVVWENAQDADLLAEAHAEIVKSTGGRPPAILDPFAGGGTIPLEAQRLGLQAHASDLNPVAVLLNKALIEIPPKFRGTPPVFPALAESEIRNWWRSEGLAADVRAYGQWMREEAIKRIGGHYPRAEGKPVIAWIWARTVRCPNPACAIPMPLVKSWWLGKKKGREAWVKPSVVTDSTGTGQVVRFEIGTGPSGAPTSGSDGTMTRTGAVCLACSTPAPFDHIRSEARAGGMRNQLMAVVAEGSRQRHYLAPTDEQIDAAVVSEELDVPTQEIGHHPRDIRTQLYGLTTFSELFTDRQLLALTTFSDLVTEAREKALEDGASIERADAIATYLGIVVSKMTDRNSTLVNWYVSRESTSSTFARQAIPMMWDFCEVDPLGTNTGSFSNSLLWTAETIELLDGRESGHVTQADAATRSYRNVLISTDPPYYDNIGYSDLSDYFYVWLRRSLRDVHPELLSTMLVPKAEELVANQYRHDGKAGAQRFFEEGFRSVFAHARETASEEYPIAVWYAFKQSDANEDGDSSTGWETLLEGMIRSGWEITSTWPNRSEMSNRMIASGTNALASSIVLTLRPRGTGAPSTDRRGFIAALEAELPDALRKLQQGQIAPVDLPQAAIGPGMGVFSRYSAVLEPDGRKMTVRAALARINEVLDRVLNEQEGDFDATSRFAIAWYRQHGYGVGKFGDADSLARARNTSVDAMDRDEILTSRAGKVQLIKPADLSWAYDVLQDSHTSNWEALHHLIKVLERDGIAPAGDFLKAALTRTDHAVDADLVKELAHLLFRIAEGSGWTKDALSFNNLVTSWPEILEAAHSVTQAGAEQAAFDFDGGDD